MELRRFRLMQNMPENGIIVLRSNPKFYKAEHIFYPFRQQSDFLYFTGFNEPGDAAVVFQKLSQLNSKGRDYEMTMFVEPKDEVKEKWEGKILSIDEVLALSSCDSAVPFGNFHSMLAKTIESSSVAYINTNLLNVMGKSKQNIFRQGE